MGANNAKSDNDLDLINEYIQLKTEYDHRFGEVMIYKHKRLNELVLVKEKVYENQKVYDINREMAKDRAKMNHEHISTIIYSNFNIEKEWCSTFYKGTLGFEYHDMSLDKLLREMKTSQAPTEIVNFSYLKSVVV